MILAGDEFADQHDLFDEHGNVTQDGGKQVDPVNFGRLADDRRQRVKDHAARLIHLRTRHDALSVNDTASSCPKTRFAAGSAIFRGFSWSDVRGFSQ